MRVAKLPTGERLLRLRQAVELTRHSEALGGLATGYLAFRPQPADRVQRAVGLVLAGPVEPAQPLEENRFQLVFHRSRLDQGVPERGPFSAAHDRGIVFDRRNGGGSSRFESFADCGHASIMSHAFDSCLSITHCSARFAVRGRPEIACLRWMTERRQTTGAASIPQ